MFNVFDTEQEVINAQQHDFTVWKTVKTPIFNNQAYWESTTAWSEVRQRQDGKWVYHVCPWGLQTHTQESYDTTWFVINGE